MGHGSPGQVPAPDPSDPGGRVPGGVSGSDGSKHLTLGGLVGCRRNSPGGMARGLGCERFGRQEEGKETQLLFSSSVC